MAHSRPTGFPRVGAIHIMFITSFALKACVSPALIGRPLTMGARPIVACARSDAKNPNNEAYWLSRQYKERPANWKAKASETKRSGQLTAKANAAGSKTQATVRLIGKVMHSVNLSAKRVLGEKTQVLKAGSIMKHTAEEKRSGRAPGGVPATRSARPHGPVQR